MQPDNITLDTKLGTMKNIPPSLLGWLVLACIAGFLVWTMDTRISGQLDNLIATNQRMVLALERLVERIDRLQKVPNSKDGILF